MDIEIVAGWTAIYLVVGLLMWMEAKTRNDISLKVRGRKEWREPKFFKIVPFWLPFYILAFLPKKWRFTDWLYK